MVLGAGSDGGKKIIIFDLLKKHMCVECVVGWGDADDDGKVNEENIQTSEEIQRDTVFTAGAGQATCEINFSLNIKLSLSLHYAKLNATHNIFN